MPGRGTGTGKIIIGGEEFTLPNAPAQVLNFRTHPDYDFIRTNEERRRGDPFMNKNWGKRRDGDRKEIVTLQQLRDAQAIQMVVLHTDLLSSAKLCYQTLSNKGFSTHFMIDWDGTVIQGLDVRLTAFHAGPVNSVSIGIDLNNEMPNLLNREEAEQFARYDKKFASEGEQFLRYRSRVMRINGSKKQSFGYTDAQYQALIELLKVLTLELKIPVQIPVDSSGAVIPNMLEGDSFQGVVGHWHFKASRWDPGPGFDWERMLLGLTGQYNSFPVLLNDQKNISALVTPRKIRAGSRKLYENTERKALGGTYPVGRHLNWHGGVHLYARHGTPVRAMFDGKLVAAHLTAEETALGSNNFVLLRHDVEFPAREDEEPRTLKFYSLYMHLRPAGPKAPEAPEWLERIRGDVKGDVKAGSKARKARDDDGDDRDREDEDDAGEIRKRGRVLLRSGLGWDALRRDRIALFPTDDDKAIRIKAGDIIGAVGSYGTEADRADLVQVEVFTDGTWRHAVDMSVHRRYFTIFSEDVERSLRVRSPDVLGLLSSGEAGAGSPRMSPDDVDEFFAGSETESDRRLFRRAVTRHVSEWSDQVDWFQALVADPKTGEAPEKWSDIVRELSGLMENEQSPLYASRALKEVFEGVLPFVWLTRDVAEAVGLNADPWKGVLFHFHPIYFLEWLTLRAAGKGRVVWKGLSRKELRKKLETESQDYEAMRAGNRSEAVAEYFEEEAIISLDDLADTGALEEELESFRDLDLPFTWPLDEMKRK